MGEQISCAMPGGGSADAYAAGTRGPGVLLYMDAIGLRPQIMDMAERIASWGYVVLAPNTFWRSGRAVDLAPKKDLRVADNRAEYFGAAMDRVRGLKTELALADADVWIASLRARSGPGPIATVGYCFGGRLALRTAAARPDDVAVLGMFHAGGIVTDAPDSPHLDVPLIRAYVVAGHADADRSNTPEQIAAFDDALVAAGRPHRTTVYPGAAHGFTMADTSSYQEVGAERHFTELREALELGLPA